MKLTPLLFCIAIFLRSPAQDTALYLEKNFIPLDSAGQVPALCPDPFGPGYQLFLTGESHALGSDAVISTFVTEYLYRQRHLRTLVMELPMSNEPFINAYILRGNRDSLNMLRRAGGFNKVFRREMEFLRGLNKKAAGEADRIRVVCLDVEQEYRNPLRILEQLLPEGQAPSPIGKNVELLRSMIKQREKPDKALMQQSFSILARDLEANQTAWAEFMGGHYVLFEKLIRGTDLGADYDIEPFYRVIGPETRRNDSIFVNQREEFMYRNLTTLLSQNPGACLFGQFGKAHVSLKASEEDEHSSGWNCLAYRLNAYPGSPVHGRVCAMDIVYPGRLFFSGGHYTESFMAALSARLAGMKPGPVFIIDVRPADCPWPELHERYCFLIGTSR